MKYYHEFWSDENGKEELKRAEVTKETAIMLLSDGYNEPCKLVDIPCYYRLMFGGVEVVEE